MSDVNQQSMLPIGTVVGGRYRIVRYLSSGGFGNTYEAEHTDLGNRCAIKEYFVDGMTHRGHNGLSVEVSNTQNLNIYNSQLDKFRQEAQLLNKMQHPGIVRVHDLFVDNQTAYYAMDIIDGQSLAAILKQNGPLSEQQALRYISQVLDALAYVHSRGLLHLDIKPGNIMIDRATDRAVLIDFGATKQFDRSSTGFSSTAPAFTKGYAPPEQINYNKVKIGPWTDLYALGATLFTLTTGEFPPLSDDITDYEDAAFRFAADATPAFRQLVVWLMQQPTKRRPQSVPEVQQFLSPKEPGQKPKPGGPSHEPKSLRQRAEEGDPAAQNELGACYYRGKGVEQDYAKAVKWFRKSAEQGNAKGQYNLGVCFYNGQGVSQNEAEAAKWYRKAAEQGHVKAQEIQKEVENKPKEPNWLIVLLALIGIIVIGSIIISIWATKEYDNSGDVYLDPLVVAVDSAAAVDDYYYDYIDSAAVVDSLRYYGY